MKLSTKIAAIAAAVVAGGALTGVAVAGIPSADGTITACVRSDGTPRIIDTEAGQTCAAGERQVAWTSGWRHRGAFSQSVTYAVGDVVTLPKPCGTGGVPYDQTSSSTWLKTDAGSAVCPFDGGGWKALSMPDRRLDTRKLPGPASFRIATTDEAKVQESTKHYSVRTWNHSGVVWLQVMGADVRKCSVTATPLANQPVVVTRGDVNYTDWILLYTFTPSGAQVDVSVDVVLDCPAPAQ